MAFARCVIVANPRRFFLKGICPALSEAAGSLCSAARSWVGDPVGRIICCNPQLCDLTTEQLRGGWMGEALPEAYSWGASRGRDWAEGSQGHCTVKTLFQPRNIIYRTALTFHVNRRRAVCSI